ncbi:MAG: ABC transporter ATP-binding protein [Candidatus Caldarchaeum sp.]
MVLLELSNITKTFGGVVAVKNMSMKVDAGELVGLIGPNGSGKTTLLDVVTGFNKPDEGQIKLNSMLLNKIPPFKRAKHIGRTFQVPRVFARMTVAENLMVVETNEGKARELLELVQLSHLAEEYASNLSGGQQKLLEFARTLMMSPQIVLMDEPFAGVSAPLIERLSEVILRLNSERKTAFVIVEHNLAALFRVCNRCLVMDQGSLIADGAPEEVSRDVRVIRAYMGE